MSLPSTSNCRTSNSTWQNATLAFTSHQSSELYRNAVQLKLTGKPTNILDNLSKAKRMEMVGNRIALYNIFTSIIYLAKQGLAFRGHEDKDSNLHQLLKLRSKDVHELNVWMNLTGHKWLHHIIINEIIHLIANEVKNTILKDITLARHYSLMIDETSDISRLEQISICIRIVTDDLVVKGFIETANTKAETLFKLVTEYLENMNLSIFRKYQLE